MGKRKMADGLRGARLRVATGNARAPYSSSSYTTSPPPQQPSTFSFPLARPPLVYKYRNFPSKPAPPPNAKNRITVYIVPTVVVVITDFSSPSPFIDLAGLILRRRPFPLVFLRFIVPSPPGAHLSRISTLFRFRCPPTVRKRLINNII